MRKAFCDHCDEEIGANLQVVVEGQLPLVGSTPEDEVRAIAIDLHFRCLQPWQDAHGTFFGHVTIFDRRAADAPARLHVAK